MKKKNKGFTLIELLVVILIIGVLAAIALPQYQVAVRKATLSKYMAIVKAMKEAEQRYFLYKGVYSMDVDELDIALPVDSSCTKTTTNTGSRYDCGNERIGIFASSNAQAGNDTIRYTQFFTAGTIAAGDFDNGDILCYYKGDISKRACHGFGNGEDIPGASNNWSYYVIRRSTSN